MSLIEFVAARFTGQLLDFLVMIGLLAILGILERLFPAERNQSMRGRVRNLEFMTLAQLGGGIVVSLVAFLVLPHVLLPAGPAPERSALQQLAVIVLYIFLGDLIFYWYHRAQHSVPAFWTIHELHHSDDELNSTSSLRTYLLERPLQFVAISLPLAVVVSHVSALEAVQLTTDDARRLYVVSFTWVFLAHANLRLEFGRWAWIATGPQLHRIHHSVQPEHHGKNFAQFFPVIDVVFSTYWQPRKGEFPGTGTPGMSADVSVTQALRKPFQQWFGRRGLRTSGIDTTARESGGV